jgi:hypothetical protein
MLASAPAADNVRLHQIDMTRQSLGDTFDVATAFRFFLNAEQALRLEAPEAIRSALLKSTGFTVERVTAYGYLPRPGRLLTSLCEASIEPAERVARALRIPSRFAQQLLFVAKRR